MSTRRRVIFALMMLAAVAAAWSIDGSTPQVEGVAFSVDRHTALTVGTKDAEVPQSIQTDARLGGIPAKAGNGVLLPVENFTVRLRSPSLSGSTGSPPRAGSRGKVEGKGRSPALCGAGRSAEDFLTPEGRFDLKAIRASGYQGPLDLKGLDVGIEPHTGEPVLSPVASVRISSHPDDTFWTDKFSYAAGLGGTCYALCVYDGKLIAGGGFTTAGDVSANYIASWDGSSWDTLGTGMNNGVYALTVYDNKLIAGGEFTTAGGVSANLIASWDGFSWDTLGTGMNHYVLALAVYDGKLIAGGYFTTAGGVSANYIASWDGFSWSPLGSGMSYYVWALAVYDTNLMAGGYFTTAGGVMSANYIASWDGFSWSPLGSGMNYYVYALTVYDNKLLAGGGFTFAGGVSANRIASWDGFSWDTLGTGMNHYVLALAVYDNKLIAGGAFTTAGGVSANYIASWDGSSWSPLGSGMNNWVQALAVYDNNLIAGGSFTTAGGVSANRIAEWTKHDPNDVVDGDNEWSLPQDFRLEQNYPNPFNPVTSIQFAVSSFQSSVPSPNHTSLRIYNILGQKVRTLVDEPKQAGNYEVIWDGKDDKGSEVASGIYLCKLQVGDKSQTKKMLLIK